MIPVEQAAPAPSTRPPLDDPRLDFIARARRFASEHKNDSAFRYLKAFLRANEDELARVMAKLYCDSLPESSGEYETLPRSALKLLVHPLYYLFTKKLVWRSEPPVAFDLETIDQAYFEKWYRRVYERLPEPKRVTPGRPAALSGVSQAQPVAASITPRSALWLAAAPLWIAPLWALSRLQGQNLLASYRKALSVYAVFDGHFRRYPCRHFVTYSDELNHPCRHLAFRQNCPGRLVAVQNGERIYHPSFAFGAMDDYLVFGPFMRGLCRDLIISAERVTPVGALNLDEWHALIEELERASEPPLYDVLLIDQSLWPHNGLDRRTAATFEKVFENLNTLKKRRPELRIACQLRDYGRDVRQKDFVLAAMKRSFTEDIRILENSSRGEAYANIFRSRLIVCFNSTIGYEAFFCGKGKKTLFVNCGGNPFSVLSLDPRFQLYDESADYGRFEKAAISLLELNLDEPPAVARERHLPPDGKVPERIAAFLNNL